VVWADKKNGKKAMNKQYSFLMRWIKRGMK